MELRIFVLVSDSVESARRPFTAAYLASSVGVARPAHLAARVGDHRYSPRGTHLAEASTTSRATTNAANAATNNATHAAPNNHAGLIWAIADLLRGDYKQSEYGRVILPLVLLRRLDCVLEPTKAQVLDRVKTLTVQTVGPVLKTVTGIQAHKHLAPQPACHSGRPRPGRMNGRLPVDGLPAGLPAAESEGWESKRRDIRDRLARSPWPASTFRGTLFSD